VDGGDIQLAQTAEEALHQVAAVAQAHRLRQEIDVQVCRVGYHIRMEMVPLVDRTDDPRLG